MVSLGSVVENRGGTVPVPPIPVCKPSARFFSATHDSFVAQAIPLCFPVDVHDLIVSYDIESGFLSCWTTRPGSYDVVSKHDHMSHGPRSMKHDPQPNVARSLRFRLTRVRTWLTGGSGAVPRTDPFLA